MQASTADKQDADLTELTSTLGAVMRHLIGNPGRDFFAAVEERGLTFTQVKLLSALDELAEPHSIGALSERIGLSPAAVSRAVDGLVNRGDVARQEDPRDRRSKLGGAHRAGPSHLPPAARDAPGRASRVLADLDPDERETLMRGLEPLARRV